MKTCKIEEIRLKGTPISRGVAIGTPFFITAQEDVIPEFTVGLEGVEEELLRYRRALGRSFEDVLKLQGMLEKEDFSDGISLLDAQLQMMRDPVMTTQIEAEIASSQKNAEAIFQKHIFRYQKSFQSLQDPFFRERFKDLQEVFKRIMSYLCAREGTSLAHIPSHAILIAHELGVTDIVEANMRGVIAILTKSGSHTSHAAIMAKAKGIPFVSNIDPEQLKSLMQHSDVIVDGRTGEVILNPGPDTLLKYRNIQKTVQLHSSSLKLLGGLKPETVDGYAVRLSANIAMPHEIDLVHQHHAYGVGLFRSEYLFSSRETCPLEEEQFSVYQAMALKMKELPLVIRVFDLGGDKNFLGYTGEVEQNPSLGCRSIRFLLKEREIFKAQLRAILRASVYGNISILLPLISSLTELLEAKALINEMKKELSQNQIPFSNQVRVGCMIEVPAAALIADLLAQECDFFSIGTNDLTQYTLAVDRNNQAVSFLHTPTHPSVIRLLKLITKEAHNYGIPVSICGEIAADPRFTPLLLGLGIHELSVSACHIPAVKNVIRRMNFAEAKRLTQYVLTLKTSEEVLAALSHQYLKIVPDDCLYNCEVTRS